MLGISQRPSSSQPVGVFLMSMPRMSYFPGLLLGSLLTPPPRSRMTTRRSQGDAFALFVERKLPRLFSNKKEVQGALDISIVMRSKVYATAGAGYWSTMAGDNPAVVGVNRSDEENRGRWRRKNVPTRGLDDLLEAWKGRREGMTPAEYGAAFVGPSEV